MPSNIFKSGPAIPKSEKGSANGVATLDGSGLIPSNQLPSYVDDVLEYSSVDNFPASGDIGKIYVATDTNKSYRWGGSTYFELSAYALATQAAAGLMSAQDKTKLDGIAAGAQVNPGNATTSADGLMSAGDKTKLDGIASGANKTVVSDSLADTSTTNALSAAKGKALNDSVTTLNSNFAKRIGIVTDEPLSASKEITLPTSGLYLIMARANASDASSSPIITITSATQTAKNAGSVGGNVFIYMLAYLNKNNKLTITCENYTSGGWYNTYGRITVIRISDSAYIIE